MEEGRRAALPARLPSSGSSLDSPLSSSISRDSIVSSRNMRQARSSADRYSRLSSLKPEFMLTTLSQLPALSKLIRDSMAMPPGHVSLLGIAQLLGLEGGTWASRAPADWLCVSQEVLEQSLTAEVE